MSEKPSQLRDICRLLIFCVSCQVSGLRKISATKRPLGGAAEVNEFPGEASSHYCNCAKCNITDNWRFVTCLLETWSCNDTHKLGVGYESLRKGRCYRIQAHIIDRICDCYLSKQKVTADLESGVTLAVFSSTHSNGNVPCTGTPAISIGGRMTRTIEMDEDRFSRENVRFSGYFRQGTSVHKKISFYDIL